MQIAGPALEARTACRDTVALDGLFDDVSAPAAGLCEAEVVVRGDVQSACACSGGDLREVVVGGDTVQEEDGAACNTCYWLGETFVETCFETSGIEGVKVGSQGSISL